MKLMIAFVFAFSGLAALATEPPATRPSKELNDIPSLKAEVTKLRHENEALKSRIAELESRLSKLESPATQPGEKKAATLFDLADLYSAGKLEDGYRAAGIARIEELKVIDGKRTVLASVLYPGNATNVISKPQVTQRLKKTEGYVFVTFEVGEDTAMRLEAGDDINVAGDVQSFNRSARNIRGPKAEVLTVTLTSVRLR